MIKLALILLSGLITHPVHVSMSSLYRDSGGDYRLTVRMYTDDLHLDLYRLYDAEGEYSERDHVFRFTGSDDYYAKYIEEMLVISGNGSISSKELISVEEVDIETILNFKVIMVGKNAKKIRIENKILTGLYPDQVNLFIFKLFDTEKGVKFTLTKTSEDFTRKE